MASASTEMSSDATAAGADRLVDVDDVGESLSETLAAVRTAIDDVPIRCLPPAAVEDAIEACFGEVARKHTRCEPAVGRT